MTLDTFHDVMTTLLVLSILSTFAACAAPQPSPFTNRVLTGSVFVAVVSLLAIVAVPTGEDPRAVSSECSGEGERGR